MADHSSGPRPRVLMILNNAPDYREPFLREVSRSIELTVLARPCEPDGLVPPAERIGYTYLERPARRFFGMVWQRDVRRIVQETDWDIICSSINMREIGRIRTFRTNRILHKKWIWWGHIYGSTPLPGLAGMRRSLLKQSAGALVFNDDIAGRVREEFGIPAWSFNNTQVRISDFRQGAFLPATAPTRDGKLQMLFVGRYQPRKQLERLVALAERMPEVATRLVGPGMEAINVPSGLKATGRVRCFGRTVGEELHEHFDWADLVVNPGHVGLLVMNAAQHGKGIVIDSSSSHAPEYLLAREAGQPFIDFSRESEVDDFVRSIVGVPDVSDAGTTLREWGERLQQVAKERYTIEHMAAVHRSAFESVFPTGNRPFN